LRTGFSRGCCSCTVEWDFQGFSLSVMRDRSASAPLFQCCQVCVLPFFAFFLPFIYCDLSKLSSGDKESAIHGVGLKREEFSQQQAGVCGLHVVI